MLAAGNKEMEKAFSVVPASRAVPHPRWGELAARPVNLCEYSPLAMC
jgi:hypothetical protein